jgi:hypothetical protein
MNRPFPVARPNRLAVAGAVVIVALAATSLAACGSVDSATPGATNAQGDRPPKKRRAAATAGKVTWVEGVSVEPGNLAGRCKNVTDVAMDSQYVYFTNSAGIGRAPLDGNGTYPCDGIAAGTGITSVAAGGGKITYVQNGKVEPGNLAGRCKNVTDVAMDSQYVYFTNGEGVGRVLREGNEVSTCDEVRWAQAAGGPYGPFTSVAASP